MHLRAKSGKEILDGQPAATVIASDFEEVIQKGQKALGSKKFLHLVPMTCVLPRLQVLSRTLSLSLRAFLQGWEWEKHAIFAHYKGLREMVYFGLLWVRQILHTLVLPASVI